MALTTCTECGGRVSDKALFCPHCGLVRGSLDLEAIMAKMIPPPMLTRAELAALTGCKQKSRQVQWLSDRKIPHTLNAFLEPLVLREQLVVTYGGLGQVKRKSAAPAGPNWKAIGMASPNVSPPEPSVLLTKNEVTLMTGRAQKSRQVIWLQEHQIPYTLSPHGDPLVSRSAAAKRPERPGKP